MEHRHKKDMAMATFPARQIAFGNPDSDGTLVSNPSLTYDSVSRDLEVSIDGGFNALDAKNLSGISVFCGEGGQTVLTSEQTVALVCGDNQQESITLQTVGIGIEIESEDLGISLRADKGVLKLQNLPTSKIGFFGSAGVVKPTVAGSCGGNAALASLIAAFAALGIVTNNTTP
jgi:hypothetical protein